MPAVRVPNVPMTILVRSLAVRLRNPHRFTTRATRFSRLLPGKIATAVTHTSVFHSALVGARDVHVFPIFRDRAASDLDTLRLENAGDLLVG
jgi:hypothetical protein